MYIFRCVRFSKLWSTARRSSQIFVKLEANIAERRGGEGTKGRDVSCVQLDCVKLPHVGKKGGTSALFKYGLPNEGGSAGLSGTGDAAYASSIALES